MKAVLVIVNSFAIGYIGSGPAYPGANSHDMSAVRVSWSPIFQSKELIHSLDDHKKAI